MIYDISPVNSYTGNGVTTKFDFDFYIENESQLNVYKYNALGAKFKLIYNVDYSINEFKNINGSYIIFPINNSSHGILAQNERISLELTLPISQDTQYNNSSLLNLEELEYSFDYLTRLVQIFAKKFDSCILLSDYTSSNISELIQQVINCSSTAQETYQNIINYEYNIATQNSLGLVKPDCSTIVIDDDGTISTNLDSLLALKANTDGSNMSTSVKNFDGQWQKTTGGALASDVALPTTDELEYSLADKLPDDNYNYEALFTVSVTTGTSSGNIAQAQLRTDLQTFAIHVCRATTRSSSSVTASGSVILPVGTGRVVSMYPITNNTGTFTLSMRGYRRIGTNQ